MYKSSGAWMSEIRKQSYYSSDGSKTIPIVLNNNNFAKGENATLLSFDDCRTVLQILSLSISPSLILILLKN